jgi:hypothetical protein
MEYCLAATYYPCASAIGIYVQLYAITDQYFNPVQTHFARKVRQNDIPGTEFDAKERVGERLFDDSFYNLCIRHICATKNSNTWPSRQAIWRAAV